MKFILIILVISSLCLADQSQLVPIYTKTLVIKVSGDNHAILIYVIYMYLS